MVFKRQDCIEKLLLGIDEAISDITGVGYVKRTLRVLPPIHVHGKVETGGRSIDLVFGVDDASQVVGVETSVNDEILSRLIKDRYLGYTRKRTERVAREALSNSNWVIVLGHSFGKTDGRWWKFIFDGLCASQYNLVFCPYYSTMDDVPPYVFDPIRYPRMSAERIFGSVEAAFRDRIYEPRFMSHVYVLEPIDVEAPDGTSNCCDYLNLAWFGRRCVDIGAKELNQGQSSFEDGSNR